jgi:hypothetical protein
MNFNRTSLLAASAFAVLAAASLPATTLSLAFGGTESTHAGQRVMQASAESTHAGKPVMLAGAESDQNGRPVMLAGAEADQNGHPVMLATSWNPTIYGIQSSTVRA